MTRDLARVALDKMRGGPLLAVSPERSEAILAAAFEQLIATAIAATREAVAEEHAACLAIAHEYGKGSSGDHVERLIRARGAK